MRIDPHSHVPVFRQIADGVRAAVAAGVHRPGEGLPSIRSLALEVGVNPNTVQRAYDTLEREGLIVRRRGVGMFVARLGVHSAKSGAEQAVQAVFVEGAEAARAAGMSPTATRAVFHDAMSQAYGPSRKRR